MTTSMRNAIEQAAYEVGLATAKYELLIAKNDGAILAAISPLGLGNEVTSVAPKRQTALPRAFAKGAPAPKATKAARVKKDTGPRTKGVKDAIVSLITSAPMTVEGIIARTGFKETSIRATLMGLKKSGLAMQDGKAWAAWGMAEGGNSEATQHGGA